MADEKNQANKPADDRGISASGTVDPKKGPAPSAPANEPNIQSPDDNPKITAPRDTVPTAAQASGPSMEHPTSLRVDETLDTKEMQEARARIAAEAGEAAIPDETDVGDAIQCIAKQRLYDDRGALVEPGATYYYTPKPGVAFPYPVLEPVNKAKAQAMRKEYEESRGVADQKEEERRKRAEALARLAAATE